MSMRTALAPLKAMKASMDARAAFEPWAMAVEATVALIEPVSFDMRAEPATLESRLPAWLPYLTVMTFLKLTRPMKPHQVGVTHPPAWIGMAVGWVELFVRILSTLGRVVPDWQAWR